jgi:CBS domain containing-hemolysin-like protein
VGDYKLTVVDVDKTRISKVKIERAVPVAKPAPRRFLR